MDVTISVIIPLYNAEKYIENTINLLLEQTRLFDELIIVDDGSTDRSYEICKYYEEKYENIKIIHTENRGSGPARTTGIANATGYYLYFPDADDTLEINLLERVHVILEKCHPDLLVFGYRTLYPDGQSEEKIYTNYSVCGECARSDYYRFSCMESEFGIQGAPWNKVFKRSIIEKNGIEYPNLRRHQDEAFISNYVNCIDGEICFVPDVLYTYYANNPNLEWAKFPVDYDKAVEGLITNRKETVLKWNQNDKKTHLMISQQLFCRSVKACENLFSPKQPQMSSKEIRQKILQFINKLYIKDCPDEVKKQLGLYHKLVFLLGKQEKKSLLYVLFKIKMVIDKNYLLRKYLRKRFKSCVASKS